MKRTPTLAIRPLKRLAASLAALPAVLLAAVLAFTPLPALAQQPPAGSGDVCAGLATGLPLHNDAAPAPLTRTPTAAAGTGVSASLSQQSISYVLGSDLWLARGDGTGARMLARFPSGENMRDYAWSPEGDRMAIATSDAIYLLDRASTRLTPIYEGAVGWLVDWAADTIAFLTPTAASQPMDQELQLTVVDASSPDLRAVHLPTKWRIPNIGLGYSTLALSADARYAAIDYATIRGIYDLQSGKLVSASEGEPLALSAWVPGTSRLLYTLNAPLATATGVRRVPSIDARSGTVVTDLRVPAQHIAVAPGGRRVAYTTPQLEIMDYPLGRPLVLSQAATVRPSFSPDGSYLLYAEARLNTEAMFPEELGAYVIPVSGGAPTQILGPDARLVTWVPQPAAAAESPPVPRQDAEQASLALPLFTEITLPGDGAVKAVVWEDGLLYALTDEGLALYSAGEAAIPELVSKLPIPELFPAGTLHVAPPYAYITNPWAIWIVDVSDPSTPILVNTLRDPSLYSIPAGLETVSIGERTLALVSDNGRDDRVRGDSLFGAVLVLDVTDPARIYSCGAWQTRGRARGIAVLDDLLLVGTGPDHNGRGWLGLQLLSLDPAAFLNEITFIELPYGGFDIVAEGSQAVVSGYSFGRADLHLIDLTDARAPRLTDSRGMDDTRALAGGGGALFAATSTQVSGFRMDDSSLSETGAMEFDSTTHTLALGPDVLYRGSSDGLSLVTLPLPPAAIAAPAAAAPEPAQSSTQRGWVTAEAMLNVRSGPSTNYGVIGQVTSGDQLTVLERSPDGSWLRCRTPDGVTGWVAASYVRLEGAQDAPPAPATQVMPAAPCPIAADAAFGGAWRRAELGCATEPASITWASYAPFEGGLMIWRRDLNRIYGFFDSGWWLAVADTWDGVSPAPSRGAPPAGRQAPIRGFGNIWGSNDTFYRELAWMTDAQKGFCATVQEFEGGLLLRSSQVEYCHEEQLYNTARESGFGLDGLRAVDGGGWSRF